MLEGIVLLTMRGKRPGKLPRLPQHVLRTPWSLADGTESSWIWGPCEVSQLLPILALSND